MQIITLFEMEGAEVRWISPSWLERSLQSAVVMEKTLLYRGLLDEMDDNSVLLCFYSIIRPGLPISDP